MRPGERGLPHIYRRPHLRVFFRTRARPRQIQRTRPFPARSGLKDGGSECAGSGLYSTPPSSPATADEDPVELTVKISVGPENDMERIGVSGIAANIGVRQGADDDRKTVLRPPARRNRRSCFQAPDGARDRVGSIR